MLASNITMQTFRKVDILVCCRMLGKLSRHSCSRREFLQGPLRLSCDPIQLNVLYKYWKDRFDQYMLLLLLLSVTTFRREFEQPK